MLQCHFQGMCSRLGEDTHRKHFEMKCNDVDNLFHNSSENKNQVIKLKIKLSAFKIEFITLINFNIGVYYLNNKVVIAK